VEVEVEQLELDLLDQLALVAMEALELLHQ
jgi:hypothetical protein